MIKKLNGKEIKKRTVATIIVGFIGCCLLLSILMHTLKLNKIVEYIDKKSAVFIDWLEKKK